MADLKETLEVLEAVDALANAIVAAKADGKVDWKDIPKLAHVLSAGKKALDGSSNIKIELADLDENEITEIIDKAFTSISLLVDAILSK